jgi:hypothetical protein
MSPGKQEVVFDRDKAQHILNLAGALSSLNPVTNGGEENGFLVDKFPGIRFCCGIFLLQSSSLGKMADICYCQPSGRRRGRVTL